MNAAGIAAVNTVGAADTDLVAAVRAGDDGAFEELYRRYYPRIAAFVRGYLRDGGRAEDVTQEAFMSALRRLRQTDSAIAFKPWIFEIARNAAIDQYRRAGRAEEVSIDADIGFAPSEVARVVRPPGPASSVLDKQRIEHLRGALDELSETHHRVIVMRELEGLSYREIGERMELTPAAVESTLFRARRRLEHEYDQLDTGRRCQLMGAVIGRLAEGMESERDRTRLHRHAKRCSTCRRRARQMGVEPMIQTLPLAAKAAALIPLPAILRRRFVADGGTVTAGAQQVAAPVSTLGAPALETGAAVAGKAVAVVAAVAIVGGGGATLGGAGPLSIGGRTLEVPSRAEPAGGQLRRPTVLDRGFAVPVPIPRPGRESGAKGVRAEGQAPQKRKPARPGPPKAPQGAGLGPTLLNQPRAPGPEPSDTSPNLGGESGQPAIRIEQEAVQVTVASVGATLSGAPAAVRSALGIKGKQKVKGTLKLKR